MRVNWQKSGEKDWRSWVFPLSFFTPQFFSNPTLPLPLPLPIPLPRCFSKVDKKKTEEKVGVGLAEKIYIGK